MAGSRQESPAGERPPARGRPAADPERKARARELRAQGLSDRDIGRELHVHHVTVGRWLAGEEPGHGPDGKFKSRADVDAAEVARLRDEPVLQERTLSWREIGDRLGVSHEAARQRYGASKEAAVHDLDRQRSGDDPDPKVAG